MLQILNPSPLEAGLSLFTDPQGRDVVTFAAKATFKIPPIGESAVLADKQIPLRHADGPPDERDCLCPYPADLVLGKLATDVGLEGNAYSPSGRPVESVSVCVSVGRLVKTAVVQSDTPWTSMPVRCFLFAAPADERRRKYAGTYDAKWQEQHSPMLPGDFDLRFFNAAAPELIADGYLQGGEAVTLINVSPRSRLEFSIPVLNVWLRFQEDGGGVTRKADLWNIVFEPDRDRFSMAWGCTHPVGKRPARLREVELRLTGDAAALRGSSAPSLEQARMIP
jgi:hypothetical protein